MNYIGSKIRLCEEFISFAVSEVCGKNIEKFTFCDMFAGTGAVGRYFLNKCRNIISNDIELFSYILNRCYMKGGVSKTRGKELIEKLNMEPPLTCGFISENYCEGGKGGRLYFSKENGVKIDTARTALENWKQKREITPDEYYYLLASLIESADKVANVPAVYASYLKKLKATATAPLEIRGTQAGIGGHTNNSVYKTDANLLINKVSGDILYLDPPYNHRQYGAYYHILNTISQYKVFSPRGVTGMRDYNRSNFCIKKEAKKALENLIKQARFRYVFLSYNNEGIISPEEIRNIFEAEGRYIVFKTQYKRFKQDSKRDAKASETTEYLHVLERS